MLVVAFLLVLSVSVISQTNQSDFAAVDMNGARVDTAKLRGKVIVLNLWFINCPNCLEEIKLLNALVDEYKDNKDVVFIAPAASRKADLEKFLKKNPFKYRVIPNANMLILTKFGTRDKKGEMTMPFPMHYVLDREGKITAKAQGIKGIGAVKAELQKQFAAKPAVASGAANRL